MNEDKLEIMLGEIYSEEIKPSEELVKITKSAVKRPGILEHVIALSITINFTGFLLVMYLIIFRLHNIFEKAAAVSIISFMTNLVILVICLFRNDIKSLFSKFEMY